VVLSDGVHFGMKEAPLKLETFDSSRLGISDVALSRRVRKVAPDASGAATQVADSYTPLISKGVEFTPAANPSFFPDEMLFAYFEINDPLEARPNAKTVANLKIVDANSGELADTFAPVDTETYRNASNPVIAVGRGLRLNHLAPGSYRLDVQASDESGKTTAWHSASFTVMGAPPLELNNSMPPTKEP
jgi:hypothetical protein